MNRKIMSLVLSAVIVTAIAAVGANGQFASAGSGKSTNNIAFDKHNFSHSLKIDNKYFPLKPGTTFIFEGMKEGSKAKDVFKVTSRTIEVDGLTARIVRDLAYEEGKIAEFTDDYYAQDDDGNVLYLGEFTTDVESGSHEGSWISGKHGGKPGIFMEANPQVGDNYQQEFSRGTAEDRAEIVSVTDTVCVPYGCFKNVVETRETTPLEPGVEEHKFFAPGVGDIKELLTSGGSEILELTNIKS